MQITTDYVLLGFLLFVGFLVVGKLNGWFSKTQSDRKQENQQQSPQQNPRQPEAARQRSTAQRQSANA